MHNLSILTSLRYYINSIRFDVRSISCMPPQQDRESKISFPLLKKQVIIRLLILALRCFTSQSLFAFQERCVYTNPSTCNDYTSAVVHLGKR